MCTIPNAAVAIVHLMAAYYSDIVHLNNRIVGFGIFVPLHAC